MQVTGHWRTPAQIEAAAERYRRLGYAVTIITVTAERAGSFTYLDCIYRPA